MNKIIPRIRKVVEKFFVPINKVAEGKPETQKN